MNHVNKIAIIARKAPNTIAIIADGRPISFKQFYDGILSVAYKLRESGIKIASLCAIVGTSRAWVLTLNFAVSYIGAIPINVENLNDLNSADINPDFLVFCDDREGHELENSIFANETWFNSPLDSVECYQFGPTDLSYIALTSASTGRPKPVGLTAGAFVQRIKKIHRGLSAVTWSRVLCRPGLRSTLGLVFSVATLCNGNTLILPKRRLDSIVDQITRDRCNYIVASPSQAAELCAFMSSHPQSRILYAVGILIGGGIVTSSFCKVLGNFFSDQSVIMYGSTETGPVSFGRLNNAGHISGWCGFILPDVRVEILNNQNQVLQNGNEGNLRILSNASGINMNNYNVGIDSIVWHYPKDLARIDFDNSLVVIGRTDSVINAGGVKIAPEIIENELLQIDGIADAFVDKFINRFEVTDIRAGLVLSRGAEEQNIVQKCRSVIKAIVSSYDGTVVIVDKVPRNSMGKIERNKLSEFFVGHN